EIVVVDRADVAIDHVDVAEAEMREAAELVGVNVAEARLQIAELVWIAGIERDPEPLPSPRLIGGKARRDVFDVGRLVRGHPAIRVEAPGNVFIPPAALDEEIHPRR